MKAPLAEVEPRSRAEWRNWLNQHHAHSSGVWLIWHAKRSGRQRISVDEAVLEALCFGWIDSRLRRLQDGTFALLVTPRKPSGTWSRLNKQRVESLIASGLMTEAGMRAVETARRNGAWNVLDPVEELQVPDDLSAAFAADPSARRNFEAFPPSTQKMALWWVISAKRPVTRAKRVAETVRLAAKNVPITERQALGFAETSGDVHH